MPRSDVHHFNQLKTLSDELYNASFTMKKSELVHYALNKMNELIPFDSARCLIFKLKQGAVNVEEKCLLNQSEKMLEDYFQVCQYDILPIPEQVTQYPGLVLDFGRMTAQNDHDFVYLTSYPRPPEGNYLRLLKRTDYAEEIADYNEEYNIGQVLSVGFPFFHNIKEYFVMDLYLFNKKYLFTERQTITLMLVSSHLRQLLSTMSLKQDEEPLLSCLTPREKQIVALLQNDPSLTTKEIARQLSCMESDGNLVAPRTVDHHLEAIYRKLELNGPGKKAQLIKLLLRRNTPLIG